MLSFEYLISKRNRTLEVWLKEHEIKTYAEFVQYLQRSETHATIGTLKRVADLFAETPTEEAPAPPIVEEQPEPYKVPTAKRKVKSPAQPTS